MISPPVRILLLVLRVYVMIAVPLVAFTFFHSLQPAVAQAPPKPVDIPRPLSSGLKTSKS